MSSSTALQCALRSSPKTWLVTGCAGFIGSNLVETLLKLDQTVVGLDNFSTGKKENLSQVQYLVSKQQWERLKFIEGDICNLAACRKACSGADYVLHQAALGSVPLSIDEPMTCHNSNVTGFINMLIAARDAKVSRMVYASSSAVYGDDPAPSKVEDKTGRVLSPYAASKAIDELYAQSFAAAYQFQTIGLRYFNVFGPRQDPNGAYAAVIPKWIDAILKGEPVRINGDGETTRDFCYIDNVVQANLLAATTTKPEAVNQTYNIAVGERTTLNELLKMLQNGLQTRDPSLQIKAPIYQDFRPGDIRHSLADIAKARALLGYAPSYSAAQGLDLALNWYRENGI